MLNEPEIVMTIIYIFLIGTLSLVFLDMHTMNRETKAENRNYINKRCVSCGWRTHSSISRDYNRCPMCGGFLEEYDMRLNF